MASLPVRTPATPALLPHLSPCRLTATSATSALVSYLQHVLFSVVGDAKKKSCTETKQQQQPKNRNKQASKNPNKQQKINLASEQLSLIQFTKIGKKKKSPFQIGVPPHLTHSVFSCCPVIFVSKPENIVITLHSSLIPRLAPQSFKYSI